MAYVQTAVAAAQAQGVDPDALAAAIGRPAEALAPTRDSLSVDDYLALLEAGARLAGDPAFGLHVGLQARLSTYPFYGLVVCACKTLREAFAQTRRYEGLAHDLGRSRLEERDGLATYFWDCPWLAAATPAQARHLCDSVLAGILTFVAWLAHERLPVREIGLPTPEPGPALRAAHEQVFGPRIAYGVPVAYGRFDAALLDRPVPNADASMFEVLRRHADELLAARLRETSEPRVVVDVRREVAAQLANDRARLDDVAAALGLTPRTLQRKLADAGTSFQAVHDAARQALAEELLRDSRLNLTDVAYLLGYREQSSFNRACRDWFGNTPARTRERLRDASALR
ncbi:MAG: AraC family transcriptional regulator ligand-binding domain-containing protein [Burkholderiaceae bacterium]